MIQCVYLCDLRFFQYTIQVSASKTITTKGRVLVFRSIGPVTVYWITYSRVLTKDDKIFIGSSGNSTFSVKKTSYIDKFVEKSFYLRLPFF